MRAGNLDRSIVIESRTTALDLYGAPADAWATFATMRAQLMQYVTADRETSRGNVTDTIVTFRTRWLDAVTLDHRVVYEDEAFTIRQIVEIGRRVGLDLKCERVGQ